HAPLPCPGRGARPSAPPRPRPGFQPPLFPAFRAAGSPGRHPDHGHRARRGPTGPGDARPHVAGATPRCAGHPHTPSPSVFTQVRGGEWPPAGRPGGGTEATRTRHPRPLHPLSGRPAAHDPPPPAPSPAVAAGLNPHPVGRRTRVGRPTPALPAPLLPA